MKEAGMKALKARLNELKEIFEVDQMRRIETDTALSNIKAAIVDINNARHAEIALKYEEADLKAIEAALDAKAFRMAQTALNAAAIAILSKYPQPYRLDCSYGRHERNGEFTCIDVQRIHLTAERAVELWQKAVRQQSFCEGKIYCTPSKLVLDDPWEFYAESLYEFAVRRAERRAHKPTSDEAELIEEDDFDFLERSAVEDERRIVH